MTSMRASRMSRAGVEGDVADAADALARHPAVGSETSGARPTTRDATRAAGSGGSGDGRSARARRTVERGWEMEGRLRRGTKVDDVDDEAARTVGDELTLRDQLADRTVVTRRGMLVGLPWSPGGIRGKKRGTVLEARQEVQRGPSERNARIEREERCQNESANANSHSASTAWNP